MTQPSVQSFFSSGKGRTVKFPTIGTSVTGTVIAVHPPEQQTTPQGDPVTWPKTGEPKMQIRIEVQTDERDPEIEYDDGSRVLYVKGKMQGAVGDALRKAGAQAPEVGGKITVTFTGEEPNPGLSPTKLYTATYEKPSGTASTGEFFRSTATSSPGTVAADRFTASPPASPPAAEAQAVRPQAISEAAWNAMDEATKRSVAKTMADVPPF